MDTIHTWHGLPVGDWATWFAGIATFLAVCAAILVPWIDACRRRREKEQRERIGAMILAVELTELFARLRSVIIDKRDLLAMASSGNYDSRPQFVRLNGALPGGDELPKGADLGVLPYPIGPAIAALRTSINMYNGSLQRSLDISINKSKQFHECLRELKVSMMLDSVQANLARVADLFLKYEISMKSIDFLDKGDGTKLEKLPDYGVEAKEMRWWIVRKWLGR